MTDHPITPPPELVEQWRNMPEFTDGRRKMIMVTLSREKLLDIAAQAAHWGADQELEACCGFIGCTHSVTWSSKLRDARRPKPPSLKEQALADLDRIPTHDCDGDQIADLSNIRRALEQLDG